MIATVHAVVAVWASALRRSNPACLAMKTKHGNKSWFRFLFQWNLFLVANSNLSNKKFLSLVWHFFLPWNFHFSFSFPFKISFFTLFGDKHFLVRKENSFLWAWLATILTHCLTVLRGTDLHLYSICSTRSSFYFPVRRALLCVSSVIANTPFLLHSDCKPKHGEESDDTKIFMLRGFDQGW